MIKIKKYIFLTIIIILFAISYLTIRNTNIMNILKGLGTKTPNAENKPDELSKVDLILSQMTIEEKIGQLFICAFRKDSLGNNLYSLNSEFKQSISKYHLGGITLFNENMKDDVQLKELINNIKSVDKTIPIFVSVDLEGGLVDRLAKASITQPLPYISKLGTTQNASLAYDYARIIGRKLSYFGFNLDFAPVCDLNNSEAIKDRSFGNNPDIVGKFVESYITGLKSYNIGSTVKHFPGLGSSNGDTHTGIIHSDITLEQLENNDLIPFKEGIDSGSNIVMINHVVYDNLSDLDLPASLNKDIYNLLRNKLNFNGIVITDALEMEAISRRNINTTSSYAAFVAGADLLLMPADLDKSYNEILNAVKKGTISEERLNVSVKRILEYKFSLELFSTTPTNVQLNDANDKVIIDLINNYKS